MTLHSSLDNEIRFDNHGGARGHTTRRTTRELAQRMSGSDEILLLWHSESDHVEIHIRDVATGVGFRLEVPAASAIDAFYHPYAYAASRQRSAYRHAA